MDASLVLFIAIMSSSIFVIIPVPSSPVLFIIVVLIAIMSSSVIVVFIAITSSILFTSVFAVGEQVQLGQFQPDGPVLLVEVSSHLVGFRALGFATGFDCPLQFFGLLFQ
jgi:hypothetical protein